MTKVLMLLSKNFDTDVRVKREFGCLQHSHQVAVIDSKRKEGDTFPRFICNMLRFWCRSLIESSRRDFQILHAHDFDTLPIAVLIKKLRDVRLVYDAHESYSDMISTSMPRFISACVRNAERRLMRDADKIIVANEGIANRIGASDHVTVMNCPSKEEILNGLNEGKSPLAASDSLTVGYIGSLEPERFVTQSIDVLSKKEGMRLAVAGSGRYERKIEEGALRNERRNVLFFGRLEHANAIKMTSQFDIVLIMFDPSNRNNLIGTPNRLFESMALGVPVITVRGTEAARIVGEVGCGYECDYDSQSFSDLLKRILEDRGGLKGKGAKGKSAFESTYNWELQEVKLIELYSDGHWT